MLRQWVDPRDGRSWVVTIGRMEGPRKGAARTVVRFAGPQERVELSTKQRIVTLSVLSDHELMELLDVGRNGHGPG